MSGHVRRLSRFGCLVDLLVSWLKHFGILSVGTSKTWSVIVRVLIFWLWTSDQELGGGLVEAEHAIEEFIWVTFAVEVGPLGYSGHQGHFLDTNCALKSGFLLQSETLWDECDCEDFPMQPGTA